MPQLILDSLKCYHLNYVDRISHDVNDELHRLIRNMQQKIDGLEADIEDRVGKLEQLSRIGTLRSCAEYARFVTKLPFPRLPHYLSQILSRATEV